MPFFDIREQKQRPFRYLARFALLVATLLPLSIADTRAQSAITGTDLRDWCEAWFQVFVRKSGSDQDRVSAGSCSGFVAGVMEGAAATSARQYGLERPTPTTPVLGLCYPREEGYATLVATLRQFLAANPELLDLDAATLVLRSVRSEFPCEGA